MLRNYLTVALRNLTRHAASTFINVVGLSLGLAVCVVMFLFIRNELTFDAFHEHGSELYRVLTIEKNGDGSVDRGAWQPMPLIPALNGEFPEVMQATRTSSGGTIIANGETVFDERVLFVDPDFFSMFSFPLLSGDDRHALDEPNKIVLTRAMAIKYFGDLDVVGRTLHMKTRSGEDDYVVSAVAEDVAVNSSITFTFAANLRRHAMYERSKDRWTSSNGSAFVRLAAGVSAVSFNEKLPAFVHKYYGEIIKRRQAGGYMSGDADALRIELQPMTDVHLDTSVDSAPEEIGRPVYSFILGGIALLVLLIACINFVLLAVGRSAGRAKEVGVRKVLGAIRQQLIGQFWGEAMLLCAISLVFGLILAELFLPTFSTLARTNLRLDLISDGGILLGVMGLLLLAGLGAGSYPAFYLSRFEPVETLKGKFKLGGRNMFMRSLIAFQFGLSIFLVCSALLVREQAQFLVSKNLGFRPEQVVVLPLFGSDPEHALQLAERVRTKVNGNPSFLQTSVTSGAFTHGYDLEGFKVNGEGKSTFTYRVDEQFLPTLGIDLKEGRNFMGGSSSDERSGIIVNEAFARMMGWSAPVVGRRITGSDSEMMEGREVIGVVPDFHFTSLRQEIRPVMMFTMKNWPLDDLLLRISHEGVPSTMQQLRSIWREVNPGAPFKPSFLDEDFRKLYENETRWGEIISIASGLAVVLACLGLFGMIKLAVAARTKEIGIRKVLGATGAGIVRLVSREFLVLVLLGNLIAWPAAWLAARSFLENYAYRIDISVSTFLWAGAVAMLVAMISIGSQVFRASRSNPVESLRYE